MSGNRELDSRRVESDKTNILKDSIEGIGVAAGSDRKAVPASIRIRARFSRILLKLIASRNNSAEYSIDEDYGNAGQKRNNELTVRLLTALLRLPKEIVRTLLPGSIRRSVQTRLKKCAAYILPLPFKGNVVSEAWGLNIVGDFSAQTGLGESARATLRSTRAAGLDARTFSVALSGSAGRELNDQSDNDQSLDYGINLINLNPDQVYHGLTDLVEVMVNRYNIGYWVWELKKLPESWISLARNYNEIWTPSTHSQLAIERCTGLPVTCIPHSISPEVREDITLRTFGLPEDAFLFLVMCDFFSLPERKNPLDAIRAYQMAFPDCGRDTVLVLKISNIEHRLDVKEAIEKAVLQNESIHVVRGYLDRSHTLGLIRACHAFISLHRAEGFGLPLAEAMWMGKPVIATGWSGNMEFMTQENSFPVRYRLMPLGRDIGPYAKGDRWAEPDVHHAAELMRLVASDSDLRRNVGSRAAEHIRMRLSPQAVGERIQNRLWEIVTGCNF